MKAKELDIEIEEDTVITGDGSHTLKIKGHNEHYHSTFGAVEEAVHVYCKAGFRHISKTKKTIRLLEVGFGTGLNALVTILKALELDVKLKYTGIEPFPPKEEVIKKLNYSSIINDNSATKVWEFIHKKSTWNLTTYFNKDISLLKWHGKLQAFDSGEIKYNLVFFDAFAPMVQPDLWTKDIFNHILSMMEQGGVLVTYTSKGDVRRTLKHAGFKVQKLPGTVGKREMIRAERE